MSNRLFSRKSVFLAGTCAVLMTSPAFAQAVNEGAQLGEIVVTAQKREQSIQEIPFTVNAVGGDSLQTASVTDVFALQTQVPGLDIRSTNPPSAGGAFSIRGLGTGVFNLGFEPSVGTVIDNIYRSRSGLVATSDFLDLERVEVLKGPQGTLFGKNTTAGLIHFVTAKPELGERRATARAEYGNYKRINLQGMVNLPIGDMAAFRLAGGFVDDAGYIKDTVTGRGYAEKHRWNLRAQLLANPSENLSIRVIGDYAKADELTITAIPSKINPSNVARNTTIARAAGSDYFADRSDTLRRAAINTPPALDAEDWGLSSEISYDFGGMSLTSLTSYRKFSDTFVGDNDFVGTDVLNTVQGETIKTFTQELRLGVKAGDNVDLVVGGFYSNEKIRRLNQFVWGSQVLQGAPGLFFGTGPGIAFTDNLGQSGKSYGLFAHGIVTFDALTLTGGIRYSADRKKGFGTFTVPAGPPGSPPRTLPLAVVYNFGAGTAIPATQNDDGISGTVSLGYEISDAINVYGTYSRGYKSGGVSLIRDAGGVQIGFSPGPTPPGCSALGGPIIGFCAPSDPTFDKETVNHFEAGMKTRFMEGRGRFNVALFRTKAKNLQTQSLLPSGSFTVINIGSVKSQGVDIDAGITLASGFELSGGVVYADVSDNLGRDLDHASKWSGGFGATYEFPLGANGMNGFVHGDVGFKSKYFTTNNLSQSQNGYGLVSGRIGIRGDDDRWEASLWCRNCTNKKYRTIDFTIPFDGAGLNFSPTPTVLSYIGEARYYGATVQFKY
jgi:iron complex outermembrane recepter protein